MCLRSLITHYERCMVRIYWQYTAWRGLVLWDVEPKEPDKTLTLLRGLRGHIFVQDCAPSVMGCGNDGGLDRSPRKRSDTERRICGRNSPGLRTGMRLSSTLLLRLQPPVSPQTTPFILPITRIGTALKYGDNTTGSALHGST